MRFMIRLIRLLDLVKLVLSLAGLVLLIIGILRLPPNEVALHRVGAPPFVMVSAHADQALILGLWAAGLAILVCVVTGIAGWRRGRFIWLVATIVWSGFVVAVAALTSANWILIALPLVPLLDAWLRTLAPLAFGIISSLMGLLYPIPGSAPPPSEERQRVTYVPPSGEETRVLPPSPEPPMQAPPAPVAPPADEQQQPSYQSPYAADAIPPPSPRAPHAPRDASRRDRGGTTAARTLQFSAFSPNEVATGTWSTLLVYTYVAEALAQIQADAATFTELGSAPRQAHGQSAHKVRQGVELTIEPHMDGVTFSPPSDTFVWRGDWRRSLFRLRADPTLNGTTQHGWVDIHGPSMTPIASIEFALSFHQALPKSALSDPRGMAVTANIFDTVFLSYSHRDTEAMRQARSVYDDLGVTVLVDELLESGDNFDERLMEMIQAANIFHLLWSKHSAASDYVRKEWAAALASGKGGRFIRPWYWRKPLVSPPAELEARKISFRYEHLKRRAHRPATWL